MKTTNRPLDPQLCTASSEEVQPWHRLGGMEHICELRKSASVLYSMLVTILRQMYSDRKGRVFGCPGVLWDRNAQKTQLWIDTELRWEDQRPDFTPAIFVSLGEIQYELPPTLDMEGRASVTEDGVQNYYRTGSCMASIVHVCDKAGESCVLADNTENYLSSLQDQIMEQYCFTRFVVAGRTPLRKKDQNQTEGKDKIVSVVSLAIQWSDEWSVKIESPMLKAVDVSYDSAREVDVSGDMVRAGVETVEIGFGDVSGETCIPIDK